MCASKWMTWNGCSRSNARTTGKVMAWSPPSATGMAPARITPRASSVMLAKVPTTLVGSTSASPTSAIRPSTISCSRNCLRVVVAVPIGDEPQRVLPDGAGAEPRARHEGRPFVARRAEDRDVGVETGQVLAHGRPEERGDPDERKIQAATAALTLVHPLTSSSPDAAVGYADAPPRRALPVTGGPMKDALVVVPARDARAVRVRPGGRFRVVDIEGGQVVDLFAFVADDVAEYASAEHTRVHVNR